MFVSCISCAEEANNEYCSELIELANAKKWERLEEKLKNVDCSQCITEKGEPFYYILLRNGQAEVLRTFLKETSKYYSSIELIEADILRESTVLNNIELLNVVLSREANVNWQFKDGSTALIIAAKMGCLNSVETLLAHGADPKIHDNEGLTALQYAQQKGFEGIVARIEKENTGVRP